MYNMIVFSQYPSNYYPYERQINTIYQFEYTECH